MLRAKIDRKLAISLQRGQFDPKFQIEGVAQSPTPIIFARIVRPMPYNFVTDSFHIKKLCSRPSSREVPFYPQIGRVAFLSPTKGGGGLENVR